MEARNKEGTEEETKGGSCTDLVPVAPPLPRDAIANLIAVYKIDPISPYLKLRHFTRQNYNSLCKRLLQDIGHMDMAELNARSVELWYRRWSADGRLAMAHSLMQMLRTLIRYGATVHEHPGCIRLTAILSGMRFQQGGSRTTHITAAQANLVRAKAHELGLHSIALAQAFQFECMLRQKDVIGEWVPETEPGESDIHDPRNGKWNRGLRWNEINGDLILSHVTSKRQKRIEVPLEYASMVVDELMLAYPGSVERVLIEGVMEIVFDRSKLPASGPVVICERTHIPHRAHEFRRQWRKIARLCGIPDEVFNMDSRSGAISEATDAGAELEHVRHAATHSDIAMTQRYSRNSFNKIEGVMKKRAAHRTAQITDQSKGQAA